MDENVGRFLSQQLYPDLKIWIPNLIRRLSSPIIKARASHFKSIPEMKYALKSNNLKPDNWVSLECKPSLFGPFLRTHHLVPFVGHITDMRLGPPILADNPIIGIIGQATTHLKPVGLYPSIDDELNQLSLYPVDANVCGVVGFLPGLNELIDFIPAVAGSRSLTFCNVPCTVQGIIRQVSPSLIADIGLPIEKWEELRQAGNIWFLDLTSDQSEIRPHSDAVTTEIWGGLYASGHIEIRDGQLEIRHLIEGMAESFKSAKFETHVIQNKAGNQEVIVYGRGIRACIYTKAPIYAIHMDTELALDYKRNRERFDSICDGFLKTITEAARIKSADVANFDDLDFSYTDSTKSFSVLQSLGAEHIADPVGIAMRNWHRKRNERGLSTR